MRLRAKEIHSPGDAISLDLGKASLGGARLLNPVTIPPTPELTQNARINLLREMEYGYGYRSTG